MHIPSKNLHKKVTKNKFKLIKINFLIFILKHFLKNKIIYIIFIHKLTFFLLFVFR